MSRMMHRFLLPSVLGFATSVIPKNNGQIDGLLQAMRNQLKPAPQFLPPQQGSPT